MRGDPSSIPENVAAEPETVGEELHDAVRLMLPWMTSVLLHASVILLTLFVVWSVVQVEPAKRPTGVRSGPYTGEPGGDTLADSGDGSPRPSQSIRRIETDTGGGANIEQVIRESAGGGADARDLLKLIGVAGGGGAAGGQKLAPFGILGGEGTGGSSIFVRPAGTSARRIAYLIDASGSLIDTLPFVMKELRRSIDGLAEPQEFTVIFFQAGAAIEVPPLGWKRASAAAKLQAAAWMGDPRHVTPHGGTNPMAAIRLAMRYEPDLLFILSDNITGKGRYEVDRDELLKAINEANAGRRTVVNTIQFLYPDPLNTLQEVAKRNGPGVFRFVSEADLGLGR